MVASATSAVMILYTSFTATTSFVVFGLLQASTPPAPRCSARPPICPSLSLPLSPPVWTTA